MFFVCLFDLGFRSEGLFCMPTWSHDKTSVSCQGPPTAMIYDFADGAQTVHTVSFPNFPNSLFVCLIKDFGSFASLHTNTKVCAVIP